MESHSTPTTFDYAALRRLMVERFNLDDIRSLSSDLHVKFDNLAGSTLNSKVVALIEYCEEMGRLPELVEQCRKERPLIEWPTFPPPPPLPSPDMPATHNRYHFLALGTALAVLLILLALTGDLRRTAVPSPITISSFTVRHGHAPALLTQAEDIVQVNLGEILTVHVLLPAAASQATGLQFTWYTCQGGSQPTRTQIDNTEFLYTAPTQPGEDCIRLLLSMEDDLLAQAELFIVVTR